MNSTPSSELLNEIIKNQKKEIKKINEKLESRHHNGNEFDVLEIGSKQINKVGNFCEEKITKYNKRDLSTSNLKKQSKVKNEIKNEMKFHKEILKCAQKLEENIRVIEEFLTALNEENYVTQPTFEFDFVKTQF